MLNRIEKLLKRCNKDKRRITLGMIIGFLLSANIFGDEIQDSKKNRSLSDFSEIEKIFDNNYKINKELKDGTKVIVRFTDGKIIVFQQNGIYNETFGITLKDLKNLNNADVVYDNLVNSLKKLKESGNEIEKIVKNENNDEFIFGIQLVEENKVGINNGVIVAPDQTQVIEGLGINNGVLSSNFGQTIYDSGVGLNNGIIESRMHGQYSSVGLGINNGVINSINFGQVGELGILINNNIIKSETDSQILTASLGINNGTITGGGYGQNIDKGLGINNNFIEKYIGQSATSSIGINNGTIKGIARGQSLDSKSIGVNNGSITTNTQISGMGSLGQEINNLGINNGIINAEDGRAQAISYKTIGSIGINNGVLKGVEGQTIYSLGTAINNGIIIADRTYESIEKKGKFYRNGISLKRDENGKLVLNDGKFTSIDGEKSYNEGIVTVNDKITKTNKVIIENNNNKIYGRKLFVNNLGTDAKTMDNHLIIDTNLTEKGYQIPNTNIYRDYGNTHITTAVAKDSNVNGAVIKVENKNDDFSMNKSTIVGYFEKDGTLVDMTKNNKINLDNSVISAVGEDNVKVTAINLNNGTEFNLNNSTINGKVVFDDNGNNRENKNNVLNLNSKCNGNDKTIYKDGAQFMTSVSDVEFKGKTDDTINIVIEKNSNIKNDDINYLGKGFVSIGNINFGEGKDSLKINFADYRTGHLNIGGKINFGSDEDKLELSSSLDMTQKKFQDIVLLNNLLNQTEELEILQLSNSENKIVLAEDGVYIDFKGTIKGGDHNDTFIANGNNSQIFNIDGGAGQNTLILGEKSNTRDIKDDNYININGSVSNFATVDINTNIKLGENAIFSDITNDTLKLNNNSLILDINKNSKDENGNIIGNALYNKNQNIKFEDMDKIVFDVSDFNQNESILTNNSSIKNNSNKIQTNSSVHNVVVGENGSIKVEVSENLPIPPVVEPEKPSTPELKPEDGAENPNDNIKPDEKPQADSNNVYEIVPNYNYLNKIYQSVKSAGIDAMQKTTQLTEDSKEGIVSKTERESIMAQLEFYGKIFNTTPYAYSHKVSKKSAMAITDDILASDRKVNEKEWIFGGKILGKNSDNKSEFNGKNLHGIDSGDSEVKIDSHIYGAYAYGEYGIKEDTVIGFAVGGTKSSTDISGNSKLKGNSAVLSTYAKKDIGNVELKAGLGYQYGEYDSKRTVSNAYQSMSVNKEYNDDTFVLFSGIKYSHSLDENLHIEPYFNISLSHVKQDGIKEKEDQPLTLDVKGKSFTAVDTETGIDLVKDIKLSKGNLKAKAGTSIMYAIDGYEKEYITGKINGASSDFQMVAAESDRTKVKFKVSAEYELDNGVSYNVTGNYITSSNSKEYTVGVGIGYRF